MDKSAYTRKRLANLAFVVPIVILGPMGFGAYLLFFFSLPNSAQPTILPVLAVLLALLVYAMIHTTFTQLEIARPSVSRDGVVPRKWTMIDIVRRRRIIRWSEISEVRLEPERGGSWWITFVLRDGGERFVRSAKGVPNGFRDVSKGFARDHDVPFFEEPG